MARVQDGLHVSVSGLRKVARNLKLAEEKLISTTGRALYAEGRELIQAAAEEVPKDTLALLKSRYVTPPIRSRGEIKVMCGFGTDKVINPKTKQPTSQYALAVHERLDVYHPVGKAKYLEDPMRRLKPELEKKIADRVAQMLR